MKKPQQVYEFARSLIGIPWIHQGRNEFGLDCGGVIIHVAKTLELANYDVGRYPRRPRQDEFLDYMVAGGAIPINLKQKQPGDILVTHVSSFPCHCGILGQNRKMELTFIHSYQPNGGVAEDMYDPFWASRAHSAFRFPNVDFND